MKKFHAISFVVLVCCRGAVCADPSAQATVDKYLSDESVRRIFAYAATGSYLERYPVSRRLGISMASYTSVGTLLMRLDQVELVFEYHGPASTPHKSLLVTLAKKAPPSSEWLMEQVSVESMGNAMAMLAGEGFFQGMNGAKTMVPTGPYYMLIMRTADGAVSHEEALPVEPGEHDDKRGWPRPEIVRKAEWLKHELRSAGAFDQIILPLLPLRLTIQPEKETVQASEAVWVHGEFQNVGRTPLSVSRLAFDTAEKLCDVFDSKGERLPYARDYKNEAIPMTRSDFVVLKPQEIREFRADITRGLMKPLSPGTHQLTCSYTGRDSFYDPKTHKSGKVEFPWKWSTQSNLVTFTVRQ